MKSQQSRKILDTLIAMREAPQWHNNAVYYDVLCKFIGDFNYEELNPNLAWFQNAVKHDCYIPDKSKNEIDDYSEELKEELEYFVNFIEDFDEVYWDNHPEPHHCYMPSETMNDLRKDMYRLAIKRIFTELENKILWGNKNEETKKS